MNNILIQSERNLIDAFDPALLNSFPRIANAKNKRWGAGDPLYDFCLTNRNTTFNAIVLVDEVLSIDQSNQNFVFVLDPEWKGHQTTPGQRLTVRLTGVNQGRTVAFFREVEELMPRVGSEHTGTITKIVTVGDSSTPIGAIVRMYETTESRNVSGFLHVSRLLGTRPMRDARMTKLKVGTKVAVAVESLADNRVRFREVLVRYPVL